MASTEIPPVAPTVDLSEDEFGPPHDHTISDSLQLWIFIPGLLIGFILIGEFGS